MGKLINKLSDEEKDNAIERTMPEWQEPMLAKLTHDHFSDESWLYERKLDGQRVIAYVNSNGGVELKSRNRKSLNDTYPDIEKALSKKAVRGCILDGEVVAFDKNNVSDFQRLQPRMQASSREESKDSNVKVYYYIFDCTYIDGHDISKCSLNSRKKLLKEAVDWDDPLFWTPYRKREGIEYYKEACGKGWEGLIAKNSESGYTHGRSKQWLKFKCIKQQEFIIGGFTEPKGEREGLGALLLGFYDNNDLVYAGEVGTGFDNETLNYLRNKLENIERDSSPFDRGEPQKKDVHFVTPKLVCEVAFTEWTGEDKLRHPRYKGERDDKKPKNVHKEDISQEAEL